MTIYTPDGEPFLTPVELAQQRNHARQQAEDERQRAADERQRADRLAARLQGLGIDPDKL
ncbi:MAG: hypothetical protein VKL39_18480 [Leptolyngbyaceae bacterium]|nr:hypothetical protein [Leptolyngbyaceae bacterium]